MKSGRYEVVGLIVDGLEIDLESGELFVADGEVTGALRVLNLSTYFDLDIVRDPHLMEFEVRGHGKVSGTYQIDEMGSVRGPSMATYLKITRVN